MRKPLTRSSAVRRAVSMVLAFVLLFAATPVLRVSSAETEYDRPWLWPVPGSYKINSLDYYYGGGIHNRGQCIDIGSNGYSEAERLDIVSATDGTVVYIQNKYNEGTNRGSGLGNYVIVQSGSVCVVYGHLQTVTVGYGAVKAGDVLGKMGKTGNATGVHLHLQAYPADETLNSSAIIVFEKFRTNPLYVEKFQFMKGLKTYSARYGDWIGEYYTNTSGAYYAYSGGLTGSYETASVSATVTVVNTGGAVARSKPLRDNAYNVDTFKNGSVVAVSGVHTDAYGVKWLLTAEGGYWLLAEDVGFREYQFSSKVEGGAFPSGTYGGYLDLPFQGVLSSVNRISSFTATLTRGAESVASYTREVDAARFELGNTVFEGFGLSSLEDGSYTFSLTVKETASYPGADPVSRETTVVTSDFAIDSDMSDKTPPFVEAVHVTSLSGKGISLSCIATDDRGVEKVVVTFRSEDASVVKVYDAVAKDGVYQVTATSAELTKAGTYTVTAAAYDAYGNVHSHKLSVVLPPDALSEQWTVAEGPLNVRAGAGTSYGKVTSLKKGATFTVTEIVKAGGYTWGKTDSGWCALDYCTYVSGTLYSVSFDLNGGTGAAPSALTMPYGGSVTIPAAAPTRDGCTFLGWSLSSGARTAGYVAGSVYSDSASATLFAVWSDSTPPTIASVTKSPKEGWTKDNVTVTVTASDNNGTVYYSFDGGKSWRGEGLYAVRSNSEIAARQIAVKDAFGNVVYYESPVSVTNVDKIAPRVKDAVASVTVRDREATFLFSGVTDELSGIQKYELVLSGTSDFSAPSVVAVTTGQAITLNDGVYYWKLRVTDAAGNVAEKQFDRFRIGAAAPLTVPTGLRVVRTSSISTELAWDAVPDAGSYVIRYSPNVDLNGALEAVSNTTTVTVMGLTEKEYYFSVSAASSDGVFLNSAWSGAIKASILNGDDFLSGFRSAPDARIDHKANTASWDALYNVSKLDLTATAKEITSAVTYYADQGLASPIPAEQIVSYPFTAQSLTIYVKVTAENGSERVYTVKVTRGANDILPNGTVALTVSGDHLFFDGKTIKADGLIAGLVLQNGVSVYAADGTKLNGKTTSLGTGCKVVLEDGSGVIRSLTFILRGDVDGNGSVTRDDAIAIMKLSNGMTASESALDLPAGDMDKDGALTSADAYLANVRAIQ